MKILISGAGIAGPTLAYWLARYGFEPALVEVAPQLRTGGYVIDFWGAGFDIAERMGLLSELRRQGYVVEQVRVVDGEGRKVSGFPASAFARATGGRYLSLPRGDLAAAIYGKIQGRVETIFGDSIAGIGQSDKELHVTFERHPAQDFDLVIGADGLHSRVRSLVFGPEGQFEKYLGYKVAAFETTGYRPRDELAYVMHTEVGQQVSRFSMRDDRTVFLFIFADPSFEGGDNIAEQKEILHQRFGNSGWETAQILRALDHTEELYFDRVSQIRMPREGGLWSKGRVTLLGDAAFCVSFLAGQGSALAMVAAYILAGELHRAKGEYQTAFSRYQEIFGPFVQQKQKAALGFAGSFAPRSRLSLFLRNQVMKLLTVRWVANYIFGRGLADRIKLPDYE
jgi:2-polyprenyl-6-methoxyphenol hydroxylase-like FAD-dependent oxidoreductase